MQTMLNRPNLNIRVRKLKVDSIFRKVGESVYISERCQYITVMNIPHPRNSVDDATNRQG